MLALESSWASSMWCTMRALCLATGGERSYGVGAKRHVERQARFTTEQIERAVCCSFAWGDLLGQKYCLEVFIPVALVGAHGHGDAPH